MTTANNNPFATANAQEAQAQAKEAEQAQAREAAQAQAREAVQQGDYRAAKDALSAPPAPPKPQDALDAIDALDGSEGRTKAAVDVLDALDAADPAPTWTFHTAVQPQPYYRDWLIERWLPVGRVVLFAGKGGVGKSRLAIQLAAGIAAHYRDWLGVAGPSLDTAAPRAAVVASYEDEVEEVQSRLPQWATADRLGNRLSFAAGPSLWEAADRFELPRATEYALALQAHCEAVQAALLVIDPIAAAYTANENDRAAVRAFMRFWNDWAKKSGCAVLMLAHPAKAKDSEYSGSTDWQAAARAVWTLARCERGEDGTPAPPKGRSQSTSKKDKKDAPAPTATALECIKSNYGRLPFHKWLVSDFPRWEAMHFEDAIDFEEAQAKTKGKTKGKTKDRPSQDEGQGYFDVD